MSSICTTIRNIPSIPRYPGKATDMAGVRKILDGYDCGVAYADYIVGRILDDLRRRCLYDDTAILITSDHGENMGEFGIYGEHATADHPTCHVPLILKWPGGRRGMDDGLHYTLDLVPTVAELLGLPAWEKWDGESFAPAVAGKQDAGRPYLVLSQMAHVCQRSVREGDWLYIRTYHDGFHLFDREMLFNLREDPYEQRDLKDENPAVTAQLAKRLLDWTDDQMMVSDTVSDPLWEVMKEGGPSHTRGFLPNYLKRLEATGGPRAPASCGSATAMGRNRLARLLTSGAVCAMLITHSIKTLTETRQPVAKAAASRGGWKPGASNAGRTSLPSRRPNAPRAGRPRRIPPL